MKRKKPAHKIRLVLVDDHRLVREGLRACLSDHGGIEIAGEASGGYEALRLLPLLKPDVVLLDINMPDLSGLEVAKQILKKLPDLKILFLTMHENKEYVLGAARSGGRGYVLKDASPRELLYAIEAVHKGGAFLSSQVCKDLLADYARIPDQASPPPKLALTERESGVLALIAEGLSNKEIAQQLKLSVRTVESHRENIMRKLDIRSTAGLTKYAITAGITRIS
ncbi:MAG: response regulator transcription factor [Planctomycetes bacterium]|nr:response regulator transcription factor [Planctomycetota bacterium]